MAEPQNLDQLTAGLRNTNYQFHRDGGIDSEMAGRLVELFAFRHGTIDTSLIPGNAGTTYNSSSNGAIAYDSTPSGLQTWLTSVTGYGYSIGGVSLSDRLVCHAGLNGDTQNLQSIAARALPTRGNNGIGVQAWLVAYASLGGTASICTLKYTNSAGVANRTATAAIAKDFLAGTCAQFRLQGGDLGVRSVQSIQLSEKTGANGNIGIVLQRPLTDIPFESINQDWLDLNLPQVGSDSCFQVTVLSTDRFIGPVRLTIGFADV